VVVGGIVEGAGVISVVDVIVVGTVGKTSVGAVSLFVVAFPSEVVVLSPPPIIITTLLLLVSATVVGGGGISVA